MTFLTAISALLPTSFFHQRSRPSQKMYDNRLRHKTTCILTTTQDYPYLSPIIKEIEAEKRERMDLDAMVIKKPASRS